MSGAYKADSGQVLLAGRDRVNCRLKGRRGRQRRFN
nr:MULTISPECIES: hypothetical protein [Moorella]